MRYYAMIDGRQAGPFEISELAEAGVRPDTYVWCKGMADWEKAEDVADICRMFRQRLYDLMHPGSVAAEREMRRAEENPDDEYGDVPSSFRRIVEESGTVPGPALPSEPDMESEPRSMLVYAILSTLLCFPLTGFVAIYYSVAMSKAWRNGEKEIAHDYSRQAKMWTGITFFLGMILYAFLTFRG